MRADHDPETDQPEEEQHDDDAGEAAIGQIIVAEAAQHGRQQRRDADPPRRDEQRAGPFRALGIAVFGRRHRVEQHVERAEHHQPGDDARQADPARRVLGERQQAIDELLGGDEQPLDDERDQREDHRRDDRQA